MLGRPRDAELYFNKDLWPLQAVGTRPRQGIVHDGVSSPVRDHRGVRREVIRSLAVGDDSGTERILVATLSQR